MKTTNNKLQQHIIFQVKTAWLRSSQHNCVQNSAATFKKARLLSISGDIKTKKDRFQQTKNFSIQNQNGCFQNQTTSRQQRPNDNKQNLSFHTVKWAVIRKKRNNQKMLPKQSISLGYAEKRKRSPPFSKERGNACFCQLLQKNRLHNPSYRL